MLGYVMYNNGIIRTSKKYTMPRLYIPQESPPIPSPSTIQCSIDKVNGDV